MVSGTVSMLNHTYRSCTTCYVTFCICIFQLKLYAQKQSTIPEIDDTYSAKGGNGKTWKNRLDNDKRITTIIICTQVFVAFFVAIIIALIAIAHFLPKCFVKDRNSDECCLCKGKTRKKFWTYFNSYDRKPLIFSTALLSAFATLYMLALASAAVHFRDHDMDKNLRTIHNFESRNTPYDILYSLPVAVMVCDLFSAILCVIAVSVGLFFLTCCPTRTCCSSDYDTKNGCSYFLLSASIIFPIFSIFIHFPYIAIAFLNNAYHAGSIFVYYSVLSFALFVMIELIFKSLIKCGKTLTNNVKCTEVCCAYIVSITCELCESSVE